MADTGTALAPMTADERDRWGERVREAWIAWAVTQPSPKPSWLVPYDQLGEADKEADRQIGEAIATEAEQRGAERAATIVDLEVAAAHGRGDSRMASELIRCAGAIRARGKQQEPA